MTADKPKILTPASDVLNDSGQPVQKVLDTLKREGIELKYGGKFSVIVQSNLVLRHIEHIKALSPADREDVMASVENALREASPKIEKAMAGGQAFDKDTMDDFVHDLCIREAFRRMSN